METAGCLGFGVCAAVDVHYLSTRGAQAAAVLAADAAFAHVLAERTAVLPPGTALPAGRVLPARAPAAACGPGRSERAGLLVAAGYADLDPSGRPGPGARAHAEFGVPVIGVAKSRFRTTTHAVPVLRGSSRARCLLLRPGCPQAGRRTWSGAWPAGTGCPTPCAALTLSREQARPSPP